MAELTIYSTIGVRSAAEELFQDFEKASGHKLAITLNMTWGTAPMLVKRIEDGEIADVLILSRAGIDQLSKQGKITPGSDVTLAGSGVAIAVKAGAPKPDIGSAEALKETLLAANGQELAFEPMLEGVQLTEVNVRTPGICSPTVAVRVWPPSVAVTTAVGVFRLPGMIVFARMPYLAFQIATCWVRAMTAALDVL